MTSAMEEQEVGWPDLAMEVDSTEWILHEEKVKMMLRPFIGSSALNTETLASLEISRLQVNF